MRVKLLRDARIRHYAGEIVEVSPAEAAFLLSVKSCEEVKEKEVKAEKPKETEEKPKKAKK